MGRGLAGHGLVGSTGVRAVARLSRRAPRSHQATYPEPSLTVGLLPRVPLLSSVLVQEFGNEEYIVTAGKDRKCEDRGVDGWEVITRTIRNTS